jgi:aminoglycoside 6'-N-acetyltransferase
MGAVAAFQPGEWLQSAIAARSTGKLVGDIGLHLSADAGEAELGFTLQRSAQGQGMATEAVRLAIDLLFEQTTAARIVGITDARNDSSMRLLERVGMTRIRTQQAMFRGEACVEHTYCIARPT